MVSLTRAIIENMQVNWSGVFVSIMFNIMLVFTATLLEWAAIQPSFLDCHFVDHI